MVIDEARIARWRRNRFALVELAVLVAAMVGVLALGWWASLPVSSLTPKLTPGGCIAAGPPLLRIQLAVPDESGSETLPTLDEVLECLDKPDKDVGSALRTSTNRDTRFFIPAYMLLLLWCSARVGGLGNPHRLRPEEFSRTGSMAGPPTQPTRRATMLRWLGERMAASAEPSLEAVERARAEAKRGIVAARETEGIERWQIRHRPRSGRMFERWLRRRDDRREARKVRKTSIENAQKNRDEVIGRARQAAADAAEVGSVARSPRWRRRLANWTVRTTLGPFHGLLADGFDLTRVDRNDPGRLVGQIGAWSVLVAGVLDLAENALLLRTAEALREGPDVSANVVKLTAGLASAKFALLVLPVVAAVVLVRLLAQAMFGSKAVDDDEPIALLPSGPERRWSVPTVSDPTASTASEAPEQEDAYGICFSGGGIRSATFALGAIQHLEGDSAGRWGIRQARYVSAVSGGSYMAAAYQFLARGGQGADSNADFDDIRKASTRRRRFLRAAFTWPVIGRPAIWAYHRTLPAARFRPPADPSSPLPTPRSSAPLIPPAGDVEDHLRRYSTHLADGAAEWAQALGEIVIRAATGLFILLLVIWTVAVPLGWAYRYMYHGLDGGEPAPSIDLRTVAGPALALVAFIVLRKLLASSADGLTRRWFFGGNRMSSEAKEQARAATSFGVTLLVVVGIVLPFVTSNVEAAVTSVGRWTGVTSHPRGAPDPDKVSGHLDEVIAGTSATARAAIDAAAVGGDDPTEFLTASAAAVRLSAAQANDALAALARLMDPDGNDGDDRLVAPVLAVRFDPVTCIPVVPDHEKPVPGAESSIAIRACQAARSAVGAAEDVAALAQPGGTGGVGIDDTDVRLATAANDATAGASRATAALRKLAEELTGRAADPASSARPPVAWAGLTAVVTLIGGLSAKRRLDVAKRPKAGGSRWDRVAKTVGLGGSTQVIAGVIIALLAVVAFSDVVVDAWRRGAGGELKVIGAHPAWNWWVGSAVALAFLLMTNANDWSLRPFYHRRLWLPYAVRPEGKSAEWATDTRLSEVGRRVQGYPELLLCAAAQTSGREWAPPGRRALSFVFTADFVGGPEVGYMRTRALEGMLGRRHRNAITLYGAVATSGAAFGPAMGRHSKGGVGTVMAIANARLGAWLPNPHHLALLGDVRSVGVVRSGSFIRWPPLWYWFMEIVGQYPTDAKLVLTSDGGHVENLGLVELLRRRCVRIMCFDASGGGSTPSVLADAIVMAREELGIEITLLPPAAPGPTLIAAEAGISLRPDGEFAAEFTVATPTPEPPLLLVDKFAADPLCRTASMLDELATRIAGRPVLLARIAYPGLTGVPAAEGWLVYGTLALANDGPEEWDLLEYGHRNAVFPNDTTGRQWFDASTFSAYQKLGRRTALRMVAEAQRIPHAGL